VTVLKPNDELLWSVGGDNDRAGVGWGCVAKVDPRGMLDLGKYGSVKVGGLTIAQAKAAIDRQITMTKSASQRAPIEQIRGDAYVLKANDVLMWTVDAPPNSKAPRVSGKSPVGQDGTVHLGQYGSVKVAGLTYNQAKAAIQAHVASVLRTTSGGTSVSHTTPVHPTPVVQADNSRPQLLNYEMPRIGAYPLSRTIVPASADAAPATTSAKIEPIGSPAGIQLVAKAPKEDPVADNPATKRGAWSQFAPETPQVAQGTYPRIDQVSSGLRLPPPDTGAPAPPRRAPSARPETPKAPTAAPTPYHPDPAAMAQYVPGPGPCGGDNVPQECNKISLAPYIIEPPDVLLVESTQSLRDQPIRGQHLVRPDGTIGLGIYGSVHVAGLTLDQAQVVIAAQIGTRVKNLDAQNLYVDVLAYNSKVYYVITDGGGYGEQVFRFPITGNETVLDAVSQIAGLPAVASKKHIWLARPICTDPQHQQVLPVDWLAISQCAVTATNYQILPGDRVYVMADRWITFDSRVAKVLSPFTRMLGFTLLGAETVQTIRNKNGGGGTGF
jgi:polysaccharide export outer membrane protein